MYSLYFRRIMLVLEYKHKCNGYHQRIAGKAHPDTMPVFNIVRASKKSLYNVPADKATQHGADAIGHHHKKALCAGTYDRVTLLLYKQGAGDIEKIKRHPIYNTGKDDHPKSITRIAIGKQAKAQHPGCHAEEHDVFYAKPF